MKETSYNKKGNIQFYECLPVFLNRHLVNYSTKCHFFITKTKMVRRNKMIQMYLRIFNIKTLLLISGQFHPSEWVHLNW